MYYFNFFRLKVVPIVTKIVQHDKDKTADCDHTGCYGNCCVQLTLYVITQQFIATPLLYATV